MFRVSSKIRASGNSTCKRPATPSSLPLARLLRSHPLPEAAPALSLDSYRLCSLLASTVTGSFSLDCPLCNFFTQLSHTYTSRSSSEVRQRVVCFLSFVAKSRYIFSFDKYLLSDCTVPGVVLGIGDIAVNKTGKVPVRRKFTF